MVPSKERMTKRHWRTRPDPFAEINDEIQKRLQENPFLSGKQVFNEFQILYPGKFDDKLLRTFQRRFEFWHKAKKTVQSTEAWLLELLQGKVELNELKKQYSHVLAEKDIVSLNYCILFKPLKFRNRAVAILGNLRGIPNYFISQFLHISTTTIKSYIRKFQSGGLELLLDMSRKDIYKNEDPKYKNEVFKILHEPPSLHGINRTTWKMGDIHRIMSDRALPIALVNIRKIIRNAGYQVRKAKKVLTSTDPLYREKLKEITRILQSLKPNEKFFSIDEFGPFAVKMQGGRALVAKGDGRTYPQYQKSKGTIIITAALELSSNQITHFYSKNKNTTEMIKLLDLLLQKYNNEECIYFSWDAASWHASKALYEKVEKINSQEHRKEFNTPLVKLAPLPSCAQFLNVIESIFSGMARAIIHNSDYSSDDECKNAIDRYFEERNQNYKKNAKKAVDKIWGKELVEPVFQASNNCKDPKWR
jgi:hypothetical protein